jgi:hypothetical protein
MQAVARRRVCRWRVGPRGRSRHSRRCTAVQPSIAGVLGEGASVSTHVDMVLCNICQHGLRAGPMGKNNSLSSGRTISGCTSGSSVGSEDVRQCSRSSPSEGIDSMGIRHVQGFVCCVADRVDL